MKMLVDEITHIHKGNLLQNPLKIANGGNNNKSLYWNQAPSLYISEMDRLLDSTPRAARF